MSFKIDFKPFREEGVNISGEFCKGEYYRIGNTLDEIDLFQRVHRTLESELYGFDKSDSARVVDALLTQSEMYDVVSGEDMNEAYELVKTFKNFDEQVESLDAALGEDNKTYGLFSNYNAEIEIGRVDLDRVLNDERYSEESN